MVKEEDLAQRIRKLIDENLYYFSNQCRVRYANSLRQDIIDSVKSVLKHEDLSNDDLTKINEKLCDAYHVLDSMSEQLQVYYASLDEINEIKYYLDEYSKR